MKPLKALVLSLVVLSGHSASAAPAGYIDFALGAVLESGDTWQQYGRRYRLYGLQACLRGTSYTDTSATRRDCGDASLAMLGAFVRDTSPICAPVVEQSDLTYVACYATVGKARLDLALMLITEGYGFASLDQRGVPIYPPYAVAEQRAREERKGLWQFSDVQHPSILLNQAAKTMREKQ